VELETARGTLFTGARLGRDSQRADWSSGLGWVVNFVGGRESVGRNSYYPASIGPRRSVVSESCTSQHDCSSSATFPRERRREGHPSRRLHRRVGGDVGDKHSVAHASRNIPEAQDAFKGLMIHWILQFALRIAFRCVLHRCGSQDIRR
jgi:hypothetical protein